MQTTATAIMAYLHNLPIKKRYIRDLQKPTKRALYHQTQMEALDLCVYRCRECAKFFKAKDRLKAHMRRHEIKQSRRYTCDYCHKSFVQQSSLITHKRIHTGEKPFHCTICDQSYGDQSTFTKHTRTHTGEKPYECNLCYQRFSQSGNLSRHKKSVHKKQVSPTSSPYLDLDTKSCNTCM